jgi:hypothetical protein
MALVDSTLLLISAILATWVYRDSRGRRMNRKFWAVCVFNLCGGSGRVSEAEETEAARAGLRKFGMAGSEQGFWKGLNRGALFQHTRPFYRQENRDCEHEPKPNQNRKYLTWPVVLSDNISRGKECPQK